MFIQQVFDVMTVDCGKATYITSESGAGIALIYVICAIFCVLHSKCCSQLKN